VPGVLNTKIYDEVIQVTDNDAAETTRILAKKEGILCGISSGAAMWAALRVAGKLGSGRKLVVILPDRGERYLSTGLFAAESP
jgi:cysteine synthase A